MRGWIMFFCGWGLVGNVLLVFQPCPEQAWRGILASMCAGILFWVLDDREAGR